MQSRLKGIFAALAVATTGASGVSADAGEAWRYGVLADTQGAGAYPDVSTRLMAPVVDRFINAHQVDMLLSVGDLTDRGSRPENELWLDTAKPIYDAGIPLYATRGNHDIKTDAFTVVDDPGDFGPTNVHDTTIWDDQIPVPNNPTMGNGPGASSYFQHRNLFAVQIDLYGATPTELIGWLQGEALVAAVESDAEHKVLFQHAPYFGKGRPGVLAGDAGGQRSLLEGMAAAGIDTIYTGHDHQYSRSVALNPEGEVLLNHLVVGSNSEKYYRYEEAPGPNEGQAVQVNDRVSYSIVDVDGPMVAFSHYTSAAPDPGTTEAWTPEWELTDRMVYMSGGDQYYVEANGSFTGLESSSENGTRAAITAGTNSAFETRFTEPDEGDGDPVRVELGAVVNFGWLDGEEDPRVLGDILVLDGLANDPVGAESDTYTLKMYYDDSGITDETSLVLAFLDESSDTWKQATEGNFPMAPQVASLSGLAYGVNTEENYVWAELNHNASGTQFAVVPLPAGAPLMLSGLGGLALLGRGRAARRQPEARGSAEKAA